MLTIEGVNLPEELYYEPEDHLWVRVADGRVRIGIDQLGCWAAGTISHLNLHERGKRVEGRGATIGSLEANKFVGSLKAPVRGVIAGVNRAVVDEPALVNADPYGAGWFVEIEPTHLAEDLAALVHGPDAVERYAATKIREYRERGILPEPSEETSNRARL